MGMATIALAHPAPAAEGPALPQNVEAEAALLGAMMIDNRVADDVLDRIEAEHFYEPVHGRIFGAIRTLPARDMLAPPVPPHPTTGKAEWRDRVGASV